MEESEQEKVSISSKEFKEFCVAEAVVGWSHRWDSPDWEEPKDPPNMVKALLEHSFDSMVYSLAAVTDLGLVFEDEDESQENSVIPSDGSVVALSTISVTTNDDLMGILSVGHIREWLARVDSFGISDTATVYGALDLSVESEIESSKFEDGVLTTRHTGPHYDA